MIEQEEVFFSEQESLQLITQMINKAKSDFVETGISALMWGSIVTFCALVQFASYYINIPWAGGVWMLTFFAVIPQIIISIRERKRSLKRITKMQWAASGLPLASVCFC